MANINHMTIAALATVFVGFLLMSIGAGTEGWGAFGSLSSGLVAASESSEGGAAYALVIIGVLASVVALCAIGVYFLFEMLEKKHNIVSMMPKVCLVAAIAGAVFAIIGSIIYAASFYKYGVTPSYSFVLTIIGSIVLIVGGVLAFKFDKGAQVGA